MSLFEACKKNIDMDAFWRNVGGIQNMEIGPPIALIFEVKDIKHIVPWDMIATISYVNGVDPRVIIFTRDKNCHYEVEKVTNPDSYQKLVEFIEWMERPILIHPTSTIKT